MTTMKKRNWKRKFLLAGALVSTLIITSACAQLTEAEYARILQLEEADEPDLTLEQLIAKMHEATDPLNAFQDAKSYRMGQKIVSTKNLEKNNSPHDEYSMEILYKTPDRMRYTSMRDGKPFSILVFNGDRAWYQDPKTQKVVMIPQGTALNLVKAFSGMLRPGQNMTDIFKSIEVGVLFQNREKLYRLICRVEDPAIAPYVIYVDGSTFLTRKIETILYAEDGSTYLYQAVSESYAWMSNVKMALTSIVTTTGKQQDVSTITGFVLNPEIPDSEFEIPVPFTHQAE